MTFDRIHPFRNGNGRMRRLILFKEWSREKGWLMDNFLRTQERFKAYLDDFRIAYEQ